MRDTKLRLSDPRNEKLPATVTVREGESIETIAYRFGHYWETLWLHPDNRQLSEERLTPDTLVPKDQVVVPERVTRTVKRQAGRIHRFRYKGVPSVLKLIIEDEGVPRSGLPYKVFADGKLHEGMTAEDGSIECYVMPDAKQASVTLGAGDQTRFLTLKLRSLEPINTLTGVQSRLRALGYQNVQPNSTLDKATLDAIRSFKEAHGLPTTSQIDDAPFRAQLLEEYGV